MTRTSSFAPSVVPAGKAKSAPATAQPLRSIGPELMFSNSRNSVPPPVGLYMISLKTIGPTTGPALAAPAPVRNSAREEGESLPNVLPLRGTKSIPRLVLYLPIDAPLSEAPKSAPITYPFKTPDAFAPERYTDSPSSLNANGASGLLA